MNWRVTVRLTVQERGGWGMIKLPREVTAMRTVQTFLKVGSCSETLSNVLNRAYDHPLYHEEHGALPFAGGIMQHGKQCGVIWGSVLAAGAQAFHIYGPGARAETAAILAAQELVEAFELENGNKNCIDLIETDWNNPGQVVRYFLRGGFFKCYGMTARFSGKAYQQINTILETEPQDIPETPVSCATVVAKQLGVPDLHTVTAAGLAGGVGLSGGGCGALAAVIWIRSMNRSRETDGKLEIKSPQVMELVDRFLEQTDGEMECSAICGRRFSSVEDHAAHLREGGCSELLDALVDA